MKMVRFFFLVIFLLLPSLEYAQSLMHDYERFDPRFSSTRVFFGVRQSLLENEPKAIAELRDRELNRFKGADFNEYVPIYMNSFNESLRHSKEQFKRQETIWKLYAEGGKAALEILGNYISETPIKPIAHFINPIVQRGAGLYIDKLVEEGIKENEEKVNKIIIDWVNSLYTNGINIYDHTDYQSFVNHFELASADLPALDPENYPVLNKELIKYAYHYINQNKIELKKVEGDLVNFSREIGDRIMDLESKVDGLTKTKLEKVVESVNTLAENQIEINKTLDGVVSRIKKNEERIKSIENLIQNNSLDIQDLKLLTTEHSNLIAQNSVQIQILSKYTLRSLDTSEQIKALESGDFDYAFNESGQKDQLIADLKEIENKETIISVSNQVNQYANGTYNALVQTGVLKGEDAERAGKLLHAIQIGTGIARVYAGDMSGLMSVFSGAGGLFSEPQESSEMQYLKFMLEHIDARFDQLEYKLNVIETKLDNLSELTIDMYQDMLKSFEYVNSKLDLVLWKQDNLQELSRIQLFNGYFKCKSLLDVSEKLDFEFESFDDFISTYEQDIYSGCLADLRKFSIDDDLRSQFYYSVSKSFLNSSWTQIEIKEIYEPTFDLFKNNYGTDLKLASNALLLPTELIKDSYMPLTFLNNNNLIEEDYSKSLENYFNYEMVLQFVEFLIKFRGYFEVNGQNADFRPVSLSEYLNTNPKLLAQKRYFISKQLENTLELIDYTIMQQSLLSGNLLIDPINAALYTPNENEEKLKLTERVLTNNTLISTNYISQLVRQSIPPNDLNHFLDLYQNGIDKIDSLNDSIDGYKYLFINQDGELKVKLKGANAELTFDAPNINSVATGKMRNSPSLIYLIRARKKVIDELVDVRFTESLYEVSKENYEVFKYLFLDQTSDLKEAKN